MARYAKGIVAVIAGLGVIVSSGLLTGPVQDWLNVAIAVLSAVLVVFVPNAQLPKRAARHQPPTIPQDES